MAIARQMGKMNQPIIETRWTISDRKPININPKSLPPTPCGEWVQNFIDRRFFRRRYNAEQVLASFSLTIRDEVDLERLRGELLETVAETMQPMQVSLWTRDSKIRARILELLISETNRTHKKT